MTFRALLHLLIGVSLALAQLPALAADAAATLRVGVLQFGTVNWELDVMQAHQLAQKRGLNLKVVPLASGDASTVALQGGAVDVIVSDWIWVTRQRAEGMAYSFAPYSNAVGSVMVKADSGIRSVADLRGKSIGINGGPYDKTWLLLRAYASKKFGMDINSAARPVFAAPPLLNELALSGQVDAALNVWHFDARLEANGQRPLIKLPEILAGLGVDRPIPLVGWVFREDWANQNRDTLERFLAASQEAKALMAKSDAEWERLKPLMRTEDNATFVALRNGYRNGIPTCEYADAQANVASVFRILAETGGDRLVGKSRSLSEGTFWNGFKLPTCPKN
ncbi:ABC transporter substrate-binding protein [Rhodoferax lacus]|uniref:ABC transporter substrate-binding protein n=1 Tax=Rhodoferax lacus TaxID=2184758 RepID=A0A3E1RDJ6_9BURK|nr:ABC transporter substrate-binding protein [Rhodoferax lacus]RFO97446.1 ABC transporter substrate-binding protein [Rhodoferax lacus]